MKLLILKNGKYFMGDDSISLFGLKKDLFGKPMQSEDGSFWSKSGKFEYELYGLSDNEVGVDIEIYKERDLSVMNWFGDEEYKLLGGKGWNEFYQLWTIKEACFKRLQLDNLEQTKEFKLEKVELVDIEISSINFDKKYFLTRFGQTLTILGQKDKGVYIAVSWAG